MPRCDLLGGRFDAATAMRAHLAAQGLAVGVGDEDVFVNLGRTARPAKPGGFALGGRVFHQKFGYGRIIGVEGEKLEISFEKAGLKKVLDRFVEAKS